MKKINLKNAPQFSNPDSKSNLYEIMGLTAPIANKLCSIALTQIDAGGYVIKHKHIKSEETYVFIKGSAEMIINGLITKVSAGDTVLIERHDIHELKANNENGVEFYAITVPPFIEDDFIIV